MYDTASGLHVPATDHHLALRQQILADLRLGEPDPELDAVATRLAHDADVPYAMVNPISDQQHFAGLHNPGDGVHEPVGRTMDLDHGFCPALIERRVALVLPDVCAHPRFASNPVVDKLGIRTYAGAPLIDPDRDVVFGTVCFVGTEPRPRATGRPALHLIKRYRDDLMDLIYTRAGHAPS